MSDFNFSQFGQKRKALLEAFFANPKNFAATFYTKKSKGLITKRVSTFSPYISTNDPQLCCFISDRTSSVYPPFCRTAKIAVIGAGKVGQVLLITMADGKKFALKYRKLSGLGLEYKDKPPTSVKNIVKNQQRLDICNYPHIKDYNYISGDEFSIEVIISYTLEYLYSFGGGTAAGLKGYNLYLSSTICDTGSERYGLNLMQYAEGGDLLQLIKHEANLETKSIMEFQWSVTPNVQKILKTDIILDILKQIITNLHFLQTIAQFTHGDLKAANILVSVEQVDINYKNIRHSSPITYKIADFGNSSLALTVETQGSQKTIRVYSSSTAANAYLTISPFEPKVDVKMNIAYYELNLNLNVSILALARHAGVPFFASFDTITFIVSLLLIPEVFYAVFTNTQLKSIIWDSLWLPKEESKMYEKIYKMVRDKKGPSFDNTLTILKGAKVKCDLTSDILERLIVMGN